MQPRRHFVEKYARRNIAGAMAEDILKLDADPSYVRLLAGSC